MGAVKVMAYLVHYMNYIFKNKGKKMFVFTEFGVILRYREHFVHLNNALLASEFVAL